MKFAATLIGPTKGALAEAHVEAARGALAALGAETQSADWLAPGEAADLQFDDLDPDQADAAIGRALGDVAIDCVTQPLVGRRKRLLVADMESTLIHQEMLDELADLKGLRPAIAAITARAMNGEIDFVGALKERVMLLKGLTEAEIDGVTRRITLMPGARALIATMRRHGAQTMLVSGGFTIFAERVAAELGIDRVFANTLEFLGPDGERRLSGSVLPPIRDRDDKLARLVEQAGRDHIPLAETLAVGDGANDVPMLLAAGLGVAFHAKATVRAQVRVRVDHCGLDALLYAQGYRSEEFVG
ncbi:MAG TPA: phosphoserine phosphatase SerB [Alphaproteobacteria bacterium]|nr:phosphoserine phosphatase SerB [Alphaproteobacteria bacterium]